MLTDSQISLLSISLSNIFYVLLFSDASSFSLLYRRAAECHQNANGARSSVIGRLTHCGAETILLTVSLLIIGRNHVRHVRAEENRPGVSGISSNQCKLEFTHSL